MDLRFDQLKILVPILAEHLSTQPIEDLLQCDEMFKDDSNLTISSVSESLYDEIRMLSIVLDELYKYRPLPF